MKKKWSLIITIFGLFLILTISCEKALVEHEVNIALKHVVFDSNRNESEILFGDSIKIVSKSWLSYNGPHEYTVYQYFKEVNNSPEIMISPGSYSKGSYGVYTPLEKGILIDESLIWTDGYCSGGNHGVAGLESLFVGIRIKRNGIINYGWIAGYNEFREYAIDTSGYGGVGVYAGMLEEYP